MRLSVVRTALRYLQVIAMKKYLNMYDVIHLKRKLHCLLQTDALKQYSTDVRFEYVCVLAFFTVFSNITHQNSV